jgi:hypothetical protein
MREKITTGNRPPYPSLSLSSIEVNSVMALPFEHTTYELHLSKLLTEMKTPERIVDDFEIQHINRRFFGGEKAIKMLEGVLGFESNLSAINRQQGYRGYQNNKALGYEGVTQQQSNYSRSYNNNNEGNMIGKRNERDYQNRQDERRDHQRPR